ncbi:MAG: hypothetical protein WC869_08175 [Phycisphaerae bacterium]|jgi:hypothetical protein
MTIVGPGHPQFWDPEVFLSQLRVRSKSGPNKPFELWDSQRILAAMIRRCYAENKWLVHLKGRKEGSSTFFTGVGYQHAGYREGCHTAILANVKKTAQELTDAAITFWQSTPLEIQPDRTRGLKRSLEFPREYPLIKSHMSLAGVLDDEPLRGDMGVQVLVASEIAFWVEGRAEGAWVAARNAVPDEGGFIIAESTPNFRGDPMDLVCQESRAPYSKWLYVFLPWTITREYSVEPPPGWNPTSVVREYMDRYPQVTEANGFWMETLGLPKCGMSMGKFLAEYPINDVECWAAAGDKTFDIEKLLEARRAIDGGTGLGREGHEYEVYWQPEEGHTYIVVVDPASSWAKRDMWGVVVFDMTDCKIAATFLAHATAWQMKRRVVDWSDAYGRATIYVEANGVGEGLLNLLVSDGLASRLYHRPSTDNGIATIYVPGWYTSGKRKVQAITILQELIADGDLGFLGQLPGTGAVRLIEQLIDYQGQWEGLGARDAKGGHFDLVAALAIAAHAFRQKYRRGAFVTPAQRQEMFTADMAMIFKEVERQEQRFDAIENGMTHRMAATPYGIHR